MGHTGGFFTPIDGGLYNGFRIVFRNANETISMDSLMKNIHDHRPSAIVCGSHHAVQLANVTNEFQYDLTSVKIFIPLGAAVQPNLIEDLKQRFPSMIPALLCYYGMSEVGTISKSMSPKMLGALAPGCEAKILGDNGEILGKDEVGEILAKTPTIMKGYLNHDEENAKFFDDKDGFVHTGDLGYFNEEGVLFYHGRKKELIKYQNCHISPIEIEDVAMQHSDIIDIGVYGFPDDKVQELVSAVVVKKEDSQLTEKDVLTFVNSKMENFKHIRGGVIFVESIPRN